MDGKQFHLRTRIVLILLAAVLLVFTWVLSGSAWPQGGRPR